ncbi:hypothetical protein Tco_0246390 [Tanacetum coccineum]
MAAGSKDRPPMLGPGRYSQWRSRFLRYIDTKPNGGGLKKSILSGPYMPTTVQVQAVEAAEGRPAVPQHTSVETILNMTPENKEHFQSEKEAIFLLLTAIERLQQGESLNVQDVKTNLFWEFGKFTSRDGESMESYYSRFYKLMNELTRNNLQVTTMQQFQLEVNDIRAERIAKSANPLALIAAAQPYSDNYYQAPKPQRSNATSSSTRPSASTRHKGKEIAKPVTPQSESVSEEDNDPEQARRDMDNDKRTWQLLAKYLKSVKPTNIKPFELLQTPGTRLKILHQAEQGVPLQAEQSDWLEGHRDEEIDEQELEAHYSYMAKDQGVSPEESMFYWSDIGTGTKSLMKADQNVVECVNERDALANLIANLTLDTEENKTILKQLKKANASVTQELEKCKTNLDETNSALKEAISCRDSCLIALQNKQNEFEKYKAFNDRTIDYEILQTKLNETLGLLALKDIEIKEGLKTKAYEISVLDQKHDDLVKKSLLTKSQLEGYLKENTKVISDLKVKEDKDIDKMIEMDKQLKFLNEIVYTRNQSIQTIHMLAPKCSTYNGRPTFANPRYLKKAQSDKPCLYEIPYDTSDPANRFAPDREGTMTLDNESRSKLNKDYVKPYDYTNQNSLYEIFKGPSLEYLYQLERTKEVRKTMWRKPFVRTKPNIAKNVAFLPVSKSISKSRQVFNEMTFNINQFREIVDQTWFKHTSDYFRVPTAHDMELLIKTLLMPLSIKSQNDSFRFEHELKTEMHEDFEYVKSLENEVDELESEKADFSNMYDLLIEECVSKDVTCSYLHSLSDLNAYAELQYVYLHKVKECECLAQKLSKQTELC